MSGKGGGDNIYLNGLLGISLNVPPNTLSPLRRHANLEWEESGCKIFGGLWINLCSKN